MTNEQLAVLLISIARQINLKASDFDQLLMKHGVPAEACQDFAFELRSYAGSLLTQARQLGVTP